GRGPAAGGRQRGGIPAAPQGEAAAGPEEGMNERPLPMLAVASRPFDSPDYLFEVKWDGVRALAASEAAGWALWGRGGAAYRDRYPDLAFLGPLPAPPVLHGRL